MRIDALPIAAIAAEVSLADPVRKSANPEYSQPNVVNHSPAPVPVNPARQLSVSVSYIENQVIVYRFLDQKTGDLIQQVPPEEMLQVMRHIDELLKAESEAHQTIDVQL